MNRFIIIFISIISFFNGNAQDSCVVFGNESEITPAIMGLFLEPTDWKEIDYVYHIHYTDSFPDSYIPEDVLLDAHEHLNEEFDEAMLTFEMIDIIYHDFDEFWGAPAILAQNNICVPYSTSGWEWMEDYVETIVWNREEYMNVHIFPKFCNGILGLSLIHI